MKYNYYLLMGNILFFYIIINCLFVSTLLWFITFLGSYLYNSKHDLNRDVQFECGFFSTSKLTPEFNFNFVVSAMFLILYDIEFALFVPYVFNINYVHNVIYLTLLLFFFIVVLTLIFDIKSNILKWYYNKVIIAQRRALNCDFKGYKCESYLSPYTVYN